jgi:hypothetical protein
MKHVLFAGCSYVSGVGWPLEQQDPNLWVNLLHQNTRLKEYNLLNPSTGGRANSGVFQDAVYYLTHYPVEYAVVSWTSMPRYELHLGVESYTTKAFFIPGLQQTARRVHQMDYSQSYLQNINDRFTSLANLHYEILNLIYYVNALVKLADHTGTRIFFVNALCPWDQNYFQRLESVLPNQYTEFTKKLLDVDTRDDQQVFDIYKKIHDEYYQAGGIQSQLWLNLYESLRSNKIDTNDDNRHPGIKSNQLYYEKFSQTFY